MEEILIKSEDGTVLGTYRDGAFFFKENDETREPINEFDIIRLLESEYLIRKDSNVIEIDCSRQGFKKVCK